MEAKKNLKKILSSSLPLKSQSVEVLFAETFEFLFFINNCFFLHADLCEGFCDNKGTCVKDARGNPSCRCVGSFIGTHCEEKSDFAYIAGGIAVLVILLIVIALFVWMICAR